MDDELDTLNPEAPLDVRQRLKASVAQSVRLVSSIGDLNIGSDGLIEAHAAQFKKFNKHNDFNIPGCFQRAIDQRHTPFHTGGRASRLKVTWRHTDPFALPIEVREDQFGLFTVSQIVDPKGGGAYRFQLIKDGVVDGLSIEFDPWSTEERWMRADEYDVAELGTPDDFWFPPREMKHIALRGWGFVEHPSADDARVEVVRHAQQIRRDLDRLLIPGWRPEPTPPPAPEPEQPRPALDTEASRKILDALARVRP